VMLREGQKNLIAILPHLCRKGVLEISHDDRTSLLCFCGSTAWRFSSWVHDFHWG